MCVSTVEPIYTRTFSLTDISNIVQNYRLKVIESGHYTRIYLGCIYTCTGVTYIALPEQALAWFGIGCGR